MLDTDLGIEKYQSPDVRVNRIKNQREWEENHEVSFGQTFESRSEQIRKQIYKGYSSIVDSKPEQIREYNSYVKIALPIGVLDIHLIDKNLVQECFDKYSQMMDLVYEKIKTQNGNREAQTQRFLSVMNGLGMLIHPYIDANGQTLRLLTLSYLHEMIPNTKRLFFPYRSEKNTNLFSFNIGTLDYDESETGNNLYKNEEAISKQLNKKTKYLLSDSGQKLLTEYILYHDSETVGEILAASEPPLYLVETLRNFDNLGKDIKKSLKNWIFLGSSYYKALDAKNQIR